MIITWTISEKAAREALKVYGGVLEGLGCMCVRTGIRSTTCATVYESARMDRTAIVDGDPELSAELRAAAECVLAREH